MPLVPINAMIADIAGVRQDSDPPGRNVYIRDVATVAEATDINFGYALVNGRGRSTCRWSSRTRPRR